jgi:hypothetical protein
MLDFDISDVTVEIVDVDGSTVLAVVATPVGNVTIIGDVFLEGTVLMVRGAYIGGLQPGALGRRGLNIIGHKLLAEADVREIVIEGSTRSTGKYKGTTPRPIRFPR